MQSKNPFRHHTPDDDPEQGTPGTIEGMFGPREATNPKAKGYDPLAGYEVAACEVCGRETAPPRRMTERREVVWCGEIGCFTEAARLAKRVEAKDERECAADDCDELFVPSRSDARFHSSECRTRQWRRERQAERLAG